MIWIFARANRPTLSTTERRNRPRGRPSVERDRMAACQADLNRDGADDGRSAREIAIANHFPCKCFASNMGAVNGAMAPASGVEDVVPPSGAMMGIPPPGPLSRITPVEFGPRSSSDPRHARIPVAINREPSRRAPGRGLLQSSPTPSRPSGSRARIILGGLTLGHGSWTFRVSLDSRAAEPRCARRSDDTEARHRQGEQATARERP